MSKKAIIGVMGPDHDTNLELAEQLGKSLAEAGYIVLTGGRSRGVMDAACRGAKSAGGTTVGIIPGDDTSEVSAHVDIPIITGLGSARNNINALTSQIVVSVGMGPGTAAELALALKAGKHCVLLGATEEAHKFFGSLAPSLVHAVKDVSGAITQVGSLISASS